MSNPTYTDCGPKLRCTEIKIVLLLCKMSKNTFFGPKQTKTFITGCYVANLCKKLHREAKKLRKISKSE